VPGHEIRRHDRDAHRFDLVINLKTAKALA